MIVFVLVELNKCYQIVSFTAMHKNDEDRLLPIFGVIILSSFYNPWCPNEIDEMITSPQKLKDVSTNIYFI